VSIHCHPVAAQHVIAYHYDSRSSVAAGLSSLLEAQR
jgi:hypothetical protein